MYIIVPVDFSTTSLNAAHFASRMLVGQYEATLLLYHVYDNAKKEGEANQKLKQLKDSLLDEELIRIETLAEQSDDLIDSLDRKVRHLDAALVVTAIGDKSRLEQVMSGSNSLRMIERNLCPILVIP